MEFYQVVMRYIFEIPVMGLEELLVYPTLWLYFLGSVNASREDTQIKANVLDVFLKTDRSKLTVRVIADADGCHRFLLAHLLGLGLFPLCPEGMEREPDPLCTDLLCRMLASL